MSRFLFAQFDFGFMPVVCYRSVRRKRGDERAVSNQGPDTTLPSHFFVMLTRKSLNATCESISCLHEVISFILPHKPKDKHPCQVNILQNSNLYFVIIKVSYHNNKSSECGKPVFFRLEDILSFLHF